MLLNTLALYFIFVFMSLFENIVSFALRRSFLKWELFWEFCFSIFQLVYFNKIFFFNNFFSLHFSFQMSFQLLIFLCISKKQGLFLKKFNRQDSNIHNGIKVLSPHCFSRFDLKSIHYFNSYIADI